MTTLVCRNDMIMKNLSYMFLKSTRWCGYGSAKRWKEWYNTWAFLNIGFLLESFHSRMRPNSWACLCVGLSMC